MYIDKEISGAAIEVRRRRGGIFVSVKCYVVWLCSVILTLLLSFSLSLSISSFPFSVQNQLNKLGAEASGVEKEKRRINQLKEVTEGRLQSLSNAADAIEATQRQVN